MNYYRLINKESEEDLVLVNDYDLKGLDLRRLWRGEVISDWNDSIKLYYEKDGLVTDYVPNVMSWLICSNRLVNVFDELNIKNIQVFPVILYNKSNANEKLNYNVVNIVTSVSALNWELSDCVTWDDDPKDIKFIRKLVMKSSSLKENLDIFLLAEGVTFVIVSEKLKVAMEGNGITGVDFFPIECV